MRTYVTFGYDHKHNIGGTIFDHDCVAVIESGSAKEGRKKAFELFGKEFCFEYPEPYWDNCKLVYFKRGLIDVPTSPKNRPLGQGLGVNFHDMATIANLAGLPSIEHDFEVTVKVPIKVKGTYSTEPADKATGQPAQIIINNMTIEGIEDLPKPTDIHHFTDQIMTEESYQIKEKIKEDAERMNDSLAIDAYERGIK